MNKICLPWIAIVVLASSCHSPTITGQKTLGGNEDDILQSMCVTKDGGYIVGGWSNSDSSGEKTVNNHGVIYNDFWIIKFNRDNQQLWQKCIGGNGYEQLRAMASTNDGGCVLAGESTSDISGDKTEHSRGGTDIWIVKLDSTGNIMWDKTIGGSGSDVCLAIIQTYDNGYVVGGSSNSSNSGDKTETARGDFDMWIIKLDSNGKIQWDKTIGAYDWEYCAGLELTRDSGVVVCGNSGSGISGDRTQRNKGKGADYWVVKLDKNGKKIWDKIIGGEEDEMPLAIKKTGDENYLIAGFSASNKTGEKSENCKGGYDIWLVKMDSTGNVIWDKTIGGSGGDFPAIGGIQLTLDGGYIVYGNSNSGISGDKTERSRGYNDYWIIKLNKEGVIKWDKTIGGSSHEELTGVIEITKNHFVLAGQSDSGVSGDKADSSRGGKDYWIVYLND